MAITRGTIIKILELVIVCVLIALHYHSLSSGSFWAVMTVMGTFGGYLIIFVGIVVGIIFGFGIDHHMDMFYSLVGAVLFIVCGVLILTDHSNSSYRSSYHDTGIAKGCVSLLEGVLLLIDGVFLFRAGRN